MPLLEPILKGLVEWIYGLIVEIMDYAAKELINVMSMDLSYFEQMAPVIKDIVNIIIALSWGLLLANMVFQSLKSMMSGIGFESEDPKQIFLKTFVFGFLLLASRQICDIALGMTGKVITMLEIPSVLEVTIPDESMFTIGSGAKWLIVIIVGFVLMFQIIKLLFEIGERYVVTSVLTFFAPMAFAMGGSKNTSDIFKGWCRMYGSMMVMMIMNIVFLKLILSAMAHVTTGSVLVWLVFIMALTRVARKIDSHIGKIGLNPAQTGDGAGSRLPGMMTMVAVRTMASTIGRSVGGVGRSSGGGGSRPRGGAGGGHTSRNTTNNTSHTSNGSRVNPQQPSGGTSHTSSSTYSSETSSARTTENRPPINRNPSGAKGGGSTNVGGGQQTVNNSQSSSSATRFNQNRSGRGGYRKTDKYGIPYLETYSGYDHGNPPPGGVRPNGQTRPSGANPQGHNPMSSNPRGTSPAGANPKVGNPSVTVPNGGSGRDTVSHKSEHTSSQSHDGKTVTTPASSLRPPITRNPSGGGRDTHITENGGSTTVNSAVTNSSRTPVSQVSSTDRSQNGRQQVKNVQNGAHTDNHITEQGGVVNNNRSMQAGTVNSRQYSDNRLNPQQFGSTRQTINHDYKNGRYNPAAVNKKQSKTLYEKQTMIKKTNSTEELRQRRRRGGDRNGRKGSK